LLRLLGRSLLLPHLLRLCAVQAYLPGAGEAHSTTRPTYVEAGTAEYHSERGVRDGAAMRNGDWLRIPPMPTRPRRNTPQPALLSKMAMREAALCDGGRRAAPTQGRRHAPAPRTAMAGGDADTSPPYSNERISQ